MHNQEESGVELLFIGDSITACWLSEGRSAWEKLFGSWRMQNAGIAGDTTSGVLRRLGSLGLAESRPAVIPLLIGTNDISMGVPGDVVVARTGEIVSKMRVCSPESSVLIIAILPRARRHDDPVREIICGVNKGLASLADEDRIRFADFHDLFLDDRGDLIIELMPDELHLSQTGYGKWAPALRSVLDGMLAGS